MINGRYNAVIEWLCDYAESLSIRVKIMDSAPSAWSSVASPELRLIYFNPNWKPVLEQPAILAHEIAHLVVQSECIFPCESSTVREKVESEANRIAVKLLITYYEDHEGEIGTDNIMQFLERFGVPSYIINNLKWSAYRGGSFSGQKEHTFYLY